MINTYKIADICIEICSIYEDVHNLCKNYLFYGNPEFTVKTTQSDIEYERNKSETEDIKEGISIRSFSDSYLETLAIYRQIAEKMIDFGIILFHGSVVAVDGIGYLFTAKSGTGKSTHTRLWREYFGERAIMVNDDKPLLRIKNDGVQVYGTAWDGKHRLSSNISVPLKSICILTRAKGNNIENISKNDAYPVILQQVYRPKSVENMKKLLLCIDELSSKVKFYRLSCNMDISAAEVAYNGMKG